MDTRNREMEESITYTDQTSHPPKREVWVYLLQRPKVFVSLARNMHRIRFMEVPYSRLLNLFALPKGEQNQQEDVGRWDLNLEELSVNIRSDDPISTLPEPSTESSSDQEPTRVQVLLQILQRSKRLSRLGLSWEGERGSFDREFTLLLESLPSSLEELRISKVAHLSNNRRHFNPVGPHLLQGLIPSSPTLNQPSRLRSLTYGACALDLRLLATLLDHSPEMEEYT